MNGSRSRIWPILVAALLSGCFSASGDDPPSADAVTAAPGAAAPDTRSEAQLPAMLPSAGVVLETMNGGGYTYARVQVGETDVWTAGPETDVEVEQLISLAGAQRMDEFHSPSLDRTFQTLFFLGGYHVLGGEPSLGDGSPVLQVLHVDDYSYLEVAHDGSTLWLASPRAAIDEGSRVSWRGGTLMTDWRSATLGRTFEEVLFVGGVEVIG